MKWIKSILLATAIVGVLAMQSAAAETVEPVEDLPELALTGPSTAAVGLLVALVMVLLGLASLAIGRRVEA